MSCLNIGESGRLAMTATSTKNSNQWFPMSIAVRVLKSILSGVVAALAAGLLALLVWVVFAAIQMRLAMRGQLAGIGAISVTIPGPLAVVAVPIGFIIGFYWQFRRVAGRKHH